MTERIQISSLSPKGYRAVNHLDSYVNEALDTELVNFIYLRASLMNGCTYCVDAHSVDLVEGGTDPRRVYSVTTWRESSFYSERERAAFAMTEQLTALNGNGGVDDATWAEAAAVFTEQELSDIVLAIGTINIWNRIAIGTRMPTPPLT
ncbi:MAG TPA: carboxymuconolactone decarboxylase family protein [Pseudolysinimonas sp.]|nr:carboxymuconolactone decarboxylase family protein [Pseudolysinimonas sp.]